MRDEINTTDLFETAYYITYDNVIERVNFVLQDGKTVPEFTVTGEGLYNLVKKYYDHTALLNLFEFERAVEYLNKLVKNELELHQEGRIMKRRETFTTPVELLAAYLLAKDIKMERIEIVSEKHFTDASFHFPKEEAEKLLRNHDRMINFTDLKLKHDLLCIEIAKARDKFKKQSGGAL